MVIKYIHEGSDGVDSDCTPAAGFNEKALQVQLTSANLSRAVPSLTTEVTHAWTTEPNQPNVADWPNGAYRMQVDIQQNQLFGFEIYIRRVNSGCTLQQLLGSSGGLAGAGIHLFSVVIDPSAGNQSDRYQCYLEGTNTDTMNSKTLKARVSQVAPNDSFQDGPWGGAAPIGTAPISSFSQHLIRRRRM